MIEIKEVSILRKLTTNPVMFYLIYFIVLCVPSFHTNIYGKLFTLSLTVMLFITAIKSLANKKIINQ